jgi:hypothetical protein
MFVGPALKVVMQNDGDVVEVVLLYQDPYSQKFHVTQPKLLDTQFFSQYFSVPCQYHSTNDPYSFIRISIDAGLI